MKIVPVSNNRICSQSATPILTALVSLSSSFISYSMNPFSGSFSQSVALPTGPLLLFSDSSSDMTDNSINHDYAASVQSDSRFITLREHNYYQMLTVVLIIPSSHRMLLTLVCRIQLYTKHNFLLITSFLVFRLILSGILLYPNFVVTLHCRTMRLPMNYKVPRLQVLPSMYQCSLFVFLG